MCFFLNQYFCSEPKEIFLHRKTHRAYRPKYVGTDREDNVHTIINFAGTCLLERITKPFNINVNQRNRKCSL